MKKRHIVGTIIAAVSVIAALDYKSIKMNKKKSRERTKGRKGNIL